MIGGGGHNNFRKCLWEVIIISGSVWGRVIIISENDWRSNINFQKLWGVGNNNFPKCLAGGVIIISEYHWVRV